MIKDIQAEDIKNVAMYLRKSRGQEDETVDLAKHRELLTEIAETNEWTYEVYQEIGSGGSIEERSEMLRLLDDIDTGEFDAVLVFDQDRLTRGDSGDQTKLMWHLRNSDTKIVTGAPFAIYDPSDEAQEEMMRLKSFFGNFELRQIQKRFHQGKLAGSKRGNWVYGTPPFGYEYNRDAKKLRVHPEEGEIVLRIIREFVRLNYSTGEIAWRLNKDGIESRKRSTWTHGMVRAILTKDIYLGNTTYNKTKGTPLNRAKNKYSIKVPFQRLPESEWKVVYNTHEALMTQEEYDYISSQFSTGKAPRKTKDGDVFELSGLCKTPDGRSYTRKDKVTMYPSVSNRMAGYVEPYMEVKISVIKDSINEAVDIIEAELSEKLETNDNSAELEAYREHLKELEKKHENTLESFKRINIGFAEGVFDASEAKEMKEIKEREQGELETEIRQYRKKMDSLSNVKNEDRLERVRRFKQDIKGAKNNKQLNMIYKSIIDHIEVERTEHRKIRVKVNFL